MNVLGTTRVLGVFGHPVAHSLSPVMHNAAIEALNIDYIYVPFHVLPQDLERSVGALRCLNIAGVNVTIPHKERVIPFLDETSDYARLIASVNTVTNADGRLSGDTTDGPGFLRSAEAEWGSLSGARVLILGAGGSAKAVAYALAAIDCSIVVANRTFERAVQLAEGLGTAFPARSRAVGLEPDMLAEEIGKADLLVNTTSVGMHPDTGGIPLPPELLRPGLLVYDLVYNPVRTRLVSESEARGARAMSGLKMLVYQGALSLEIWTGLEPPLDVMESAAMARLVI